MDNITRHIEKIVVNTGVGKMRSRSDFEAKVLPEIESELKLFTGQKGARCPSRKSESGFKVRAGDVVGLKVTLRRRRMRDFLMRVVNAVLPRVKDFRGLDPKNVDDGGSLNIGIPDKNVFPEVDTNTTKVDFGLQITVVSKIKDRGKMLAFYRSMGVPLKPDPRYK